jgi:NarL family two-component system response regulator LiaR
MGYHLKDSSPEALIDAIRQVSRGVASLHPSIAKKLLDELHNTDKQQLSDEPLTPREVEVLRLIAQGCENREIAGKLVISDATVRTHVSNILGKLHLASRTQAALYALRGGLASLEE